MEEEEAAQEAALAKAAADKLAMEAAREAALKAEAEQRHAAFMNTLLKCVPCFPQQPSAAHGRHAMAARAATQKSDPKGSGATAERPKPKEPPYLCNLVLSELNGGSFVTVWSRATPSDDALVRERSAADSYTRAARQSLGCGHATTSTRAECYGPLGNFKDMCSACRLEPEAVLRDHCRGLIETGRATASCSLCQLCSLCRGVDGRKLKLGEERKREISHVSRYLPCPGRCHRKDDACQTGWRRRNGDKEAQRAWCPGRADLPLKGKKRVRQEDSDDE
jgi:hypothetical protein